MLKTVQEERVATFDPEEFGEIHIPLDGDEEQRALIRMMLKSFLEVDPTFHFLHEPGYLLIRCSKAVIGRYKSYLDEMEIKSYTLGFWVEASPTVKRHQAFFAQYFHLISVLVLENDFEFEFETEDGEKRNEMQILERITHCFYNVAPFTISEDRILALLSTSRAWSMGYQCARERNMQDAERT